MRWLLEANNGVAKSNGSDVRGTLLQLMCCTLPKRLCPKFTSGGQEWRMLEVVRVGSEVLY